jgi:tetratricopeptide (TPR) repeat protein
MTLDPNNALAYAYYAELLVNQAPENFSLLEDAISASQKARDLGGDIFEVHRIRGIVLYNTQNYIEAADELNRALAINKSIADVHLWLGLTYEALFDNEKAEEAFLNAVTYNPTDITALIEIARSYFANGRFQQGAQYAEQAVKVDPTNPRTHGYLGIMYYKMTEYSKAIPSLKLALEGGVWTDENGVEHTVEPLPLEDNDTIISYYSSYGLALARSNRCAEAVPLFQKMLGGVPDDETAVYNANFGLELCAEGLENADEAGSAAGEEAVDSPDESTEEDTGESAEPSAEETSG